MGEVIQFPGSDERDWRVWEDTLREAYAGTPFEGPVLDEALTALKGHWAVVFEKVALEVPTVQVPGPLSAEQLEAIRRVGEVSGATVVDRLRHERTTNLSRLFTAELWLAFYKRGGAG